MGEALDYDLPGPSGRSVPLQEQPWYLGKVTRLYSESILVDDGEFLVRDSISSPGQYVLTVKWKRKALNFQINSVLEKGRRMYHFEEELFGSVVALIEFYQSHRRPITLASGALIMKAVDKERDGSPAPSNGSELEASYMHIFKPGQHPTQRSLSQQVLVNQATLRSRPLRPMSTIEQERIPALPSALLNRPLPLPIRSPRHSEEDGNDYDEMDYDAMDENVLDASSLSAKHRSSSIQSLPVSSLSRQFQSCVNLRTSSPSPSVSKQSLLPAASAARPPLPPRPPNLSEKSRSVGNTPMHSARTPEDEARDSAFVDYDDLKPKQKQDDYDSLKSHPSQKRDSLGDDYDILNASTDRRQRDSGIFSSPSPPNEVVNFSHSQLNQLKLFLINKKPADIAEAITYEDIKLLRFVGISEKSGLGADNGLRLILLPQGSQVRKDLLNRSRNIQLTVVLSLAASNKIDAPRLARQWILTASSLLNKDGNLFGFVNIVAPLVNYLSSSLAHILSSLDLQSKSEYDLHKIAFKELKDCIYKAANGVIVPFLQPILEIFAQERCQYLDETTFGTEIDSFWRFMDSARAWSRNADGMRDVARGRFMCSRAAAENPMRCYNLERLLAGPGSAAVDRHSLILENIHKLIEERS